jgi:hypothetical protein
LFGVEGHRAAEGASVLWAGIALLAIGVAWAAFKGWVVWDIAHDLYNGGGAPTLDFPVFCPVPLAAGAFAVGSAVAGRPLPWVGVAVYVGSAALFGFLLWWFDRLGGPERQRQLEAITRRSSPTAQDAEPGSVLSSGDS